MGESKIYNSLDFYKNIATALYCRIYKIGGDDYGNYKLFIEAKHKDSFTKREIFYSNLIKNMAPYCGQFADISKGETPAYRENIFKLVCGYCSDMMQSLQQYHEYTPNTLLFKIRISTNLFRKIINNIEELLPQFYNEYSVKNLRLCHLQRISISKFDKIKGFGPKMRKEFICLLENAGLINTP